MTTTGIFLKQEKKLEGLARKGARRERGYPSESSETFHRSSLFMWDRPRPRQGRWRKSAWLLSKFPFPWPPIGLHFWLSFLSEFCPFSDPSWSPLLLTPQSQKGFPLSYQPSLPSLPSPWWHYSVASVAAGSNCIMSLSCFCMTLKAKERNWQPESTCILAQGY